MDVCILLRNGFFTVKKNKCFMNVRKLTNVGQDTVIEKKTFFKFGLTGPGYHTYAIVC